VPRPAPPGPPASRQVELFGLRIDALTMAETLDAAEALIAAGGVHQHVVVNVAKVVAADRDPDLRAIINACDLVNADGQPIVWASRLLGRPLPERVAGIDLMLGLFARAAAAGHAVYLLGARPAIVAAAAERAVREHPGLQVAGARDGYWRAEEEADVAAAIAAARPAMLFLAIPSPAKERFLARWKDSIGAPFVMGVGGSFDVYAGLVRRAPRWLQRLGLEWLFRLAQEPRRMWRRYVTDAPRFAWLVAKALAARRRVAARR
jgi:N-acetylglucosaminyldiphosphoundecaprenol N-acetyl-beta-D-mannosaminyltransferase